MKRCIYAQLEENMIFREYCEYRIRRDKNVSKLKENETKRKEKHRKR